MSVLQPLPQRAYRGGDGASRNSPALDDSDEAARAAGASLPAITDSVASPLSLIADETLLFSIRSPSLFPSIAAGVALIEAEAFNRPR